MTGRRIAFLLLLLAVAAVPDVVSAQTLTIDPGSTGAWNADITLSCSGNSTGDLSYTDSGGHNKYIDIYHGSVGSATLVDGHFVSTSASGIFAGDCTSAGSPLFAVAEDATNVAAFRSYFESGGSPPSTAYGGAFGDFFGGPTRIVASTAPGNGATTPSTSVTISFDYFYNDTLPDVYDKAGIDLQDSTAFQAINAPEETIISSGGSTYSETLTLVSGHEYLWRPYLRNSVGSSTPVINGNLQSFFVITNPYPLDLNTTGSTTVASSSEAATTIYQNLLNTIENNPPFGFIFRILSDFATTSATGTPAVIALPVIPDFEKTYIFGFFDAGMAGLMFFFFAVWLLNRIRHFEL